MSETVERRLLATILALFTILGLVYSVVVPPFEASDEKWHYPMVKYVADRWALPVQEPGVETAWRQEGSQPPLYYALAAAITCWIDTSDMEDVRRLNPHVNAGATADGNVNLVVHDPALERFPWRGTVLAIHLIRFLSVLMGTAAVYLTYRIVREVLPGQPALALGAAAIHAFTPMYVFIAASVNNDNLAVPLCGLALWMLVRLADPSPPRSGPKALVRDYVLLGGVLGLAALTKTSALPLAAITAVVVTVRAVRRRCWGEFVIGGLATLLPFLALSGWWFVRNLRLYGDPSGLDVFIEVLGQRDVPADLPQLWRERFSFLAGYWGNFGGLNVPMADWVYRVLDGVLVAAGVGVAIALVRSAVKAPGAREPQGGPWRLRVAWWPLGICLLWGLGVVAPWALVWARLTWSSQGRLVFYALSTTSLQLTLGLAGWFPRRWGRWAVAAFAVFLAALAAVAPWAWIAPAYALPEPLTEAQLAAIPERLEVDFGGVMRLLGYDLETHVVEPGGQVAVTLYWEALAPAERDYRVFVHLLGREGRMVAQRDTFPGLGLLSTRWIEPGSAWADRYIIPVPETAYAPDELRVSVGLYDADGRLSATDGAADEGADNVRFGEIELQPREGELPNPISVNFGDRMTLVGYELDRLAAQQGEPIGLTLYWRGLRRMEINYTVSTQLVDPGQVKAAQQDAWPAGGAAPTAAWEPGDLVVDERVLAIYPDAPPALYGLRVAVYVQEEGKLAHLPVVSSTGEMLYDHAVLTQVRVEP